MRVWRNGERIKQKKKKQQQQNKKIKNRQETNETVYLEV